MSFKDTPSSSGIEVPTPSTKPTEFDGAYIIDVPGRETGITASGEFEDVEFHYSDPDTFFKIMCTAVNFEDQPVILNFINRYLSVSDAEYSTEEIDEEAFNGSNFLRALDVEISTFIESGEGLKRFGAMGGHEGRILSQVYNKQNLLAFAKETYLRANGGIGHDEFESILRYRVVVKKVDEAIDKSRGVDEYSRVSTREMGWAGAIRNYGLSEGPINPSDYREFCGDADEVIRMIVVGGEPLLRRTTRRPFDE